MKPRQKKESLISKSTSIHNVEEDLILIKDIFIDLDDTIFDFKKAEAIAIEKTLVSFGIEPTPETLTLYSEINKSEWKLLELGKTTRDTLRVHRFERLFSALGTTGDAMEAQKTYEYNLGSGHFYINGAKEMLDALKECTQYSLHLASNGTASVQRRRIGSSDVAKYFDNIFISEDIGYNKPSVEYFDSCFAKIPNFKKENSIIIGDSLSSDIKGGKNAGILTCLYDPKNHYAPCDVIPDFRVKSLLEIPNLLKTL